MQAKQLVAESIKAKEISQAVSDSLLQQRKFQQMAVQLADAETRAASHFVILQQHRQRKEIQEKKNTALQTRLLDLQLQHEAELATASSKRKADLADIARKNDDQ